MACSIHIPTWSHREHPQSSSQQGPRLKALLTWILPQQDRRYCLLQASPGRRKLRAAAAQRRAEQRQKIGRTSHRFLGLQQLQTTRWTSISHRTHLPQRQFRQDKHLQLSPLLFLRYLAQLRQSQCSRLQCLHRGKRGMAMIERKPRVQAAVILKCKWIPSPMPSWMTCWTSFLGAILPGLQTMVSHSQVWARAPLAMKGLESERSCDLIDVD
mmetsp:Transcript_29374/g.68409  ORF Transcript_29374/g.68409 Transcript_29374/m.68409 type:complete len:213 (+) Transcript_29374:1793-2431(+)